MINHDGDSLDCGHYISDFLIPTQEFGVTVMMTISLKIMILPKGVYIRESHKKNIVMSGSTNVLFVVYIRIIHLTKTKHY